MSHSQRAISSDTQAHLDLTPSLLWRLTIRDLPSGSTLNTLNVKSVRILLSDEMFILGEGIEGHIICCFSCAHEREPVALKE